jgi:signal transduction histidine kinase
MPTTGMGRLPATLGRQFGQVRSPASLGAKLVLIMTVVGLCGTVAITVLLASIIMPSFTDLENKAVAGYVTRTRSALSVYAAEVERTARDHNGWTGASGCAGYPVLRPKRDGALLPSMSERQVQGMLYMARDGRITMACWRDPVTGLDRPALRDRLIAVTDRADLGRVVAGRRSGRFFARIGNDIAAIGVASVGNRDGSGVPQGYGVLAQIVTGEQISQMLHLKTQLGLGTGSDTKPGRRDTTQMTIAVPLLGADGGVVAGARFSVPRDVSLLGRRMLLLAIAGSTVLLLLVLIVLRRLIARLVLRPLHRVESHMQRVRVSGSLALLEEDQRRDEIGSLGRSFNAMLRQLKDLREQIGLQSFDLGRSESAVAVMHNVRNALNPISTILSQGVAQIPPINRTTLDRALAELARNDVSDTRRRKLAAFVTAVVDAEAANRETMRRELEVGREAMAHVLEIIGQQQKAAHERPALEPCDVTDIIARNATIARYSPDASIAFSFPAGPNMVSANRIILSQVIGNLFGNAVESIVARGTGSGSILASITEAAGRVTIVIRDDGEGFGADVGAALFQRGFSTRAHKSGGLGLHWCANSVTAMDGSLRLESDGSGRGAVAFLTLPAASSLKDEAD